MKSIIFSVLLLITASSGMAQSKEKTEHSFVNQVDAILNTSRDTLTITAESRIKFIKIGDQVYQIVPHPTTIEKVEPSPASRIFGNPMFTFPQGTITPTVFQ